MADLGAFPQLIHSVLQHIVLERENGPQKLRSGSTVEFKSEAGKMTEGTLKFRRPGEGRSALGIEVDVQVPVLRLWYH